MKHKKILKILKQAIMFFGISAVGWLIDITIYTIITNLTEINPMYINIFSSIVAVTFVYITSTKKMFQNKTNTISLKKKYIIYIIYQIFIILLSSFVIGLLSSWLLNVDYGFIIKYAKIIAKIIVTPFTMITNFLFMKFLIEKI